MKATEALVIYTEEKIIADVYEGESYLIPEDVMVFEGTLDEFLEIEEFKNYKIDNIL